MTPTSGKASGLAGAAEHVRIYSRFIGILAAILSCLNVMSVESARAATVIASADGDYPDVRLDVMEIKRTTGNTVTLKLRIVNDSDNLFSFHDKFASVGSDYAGIGGVHLLDLTNKKKYLVIRDSATACVCSRQIPDIQPGSSAALWARFPAPPQDVDTISIVMPHFIPVDDVPISE